MIVYQVTITLQTRVEPEWLQWMQQVHLPDVLKTGCFSRCQVANALDPADGEATYVIRYDCPTRETYERYREHFAAGLQKEHNDKFAGSFRGSRLLLEEAFTLNA